MKIVTEEDECVAVGQRVLSAAAEFVQDDDGIVVILDHGSADYERGNVELAIRLCLDRVVALGEG